MRAKDFIWNFWEQIKVADEIRETFQRRLGEDRDLTKLQQTILVQLATTRERSVTSVAHALKMDPGNFSKACTILEEKGYIERRRSEADSRKVFLEYTDKGLDYVKQFEEFVDATFSVDNKDLHPVDGADLVDSLEKCNKKLKTLLNEMDENKIKKSSSR
ncbi:MAG: MarR family winged helix-turn-helix transcriptional regulator [Tissierellia bacterium]|nr:MarR family winged helix-turn-helix transcriptional regulator [Tissierellia bacterium]